MSPRVDVEAFYVLLYRPSKKEMPSKHPRTLPALLDTSKLCFIDIMFEGSVYATQAGWRTVSSGIPRGSQRDVVYIGWPIAPSYMSPNVGGWVAGTQPMSTAVHMEPKKRLRSNSIFNLETVFTQF